MCVVVCLPTPIILRVVGATNESFGTEDFSVSIQVSTLPMPLLYLHNSQGELKPVLVR